MRGANRSSRKHRQPPRPAFRINRRPDDGADFGPACPRDMEPRHRTTRGTDSRNHIRRKPLHRILEDLLPGLFRPPPSRRLQRPVFRRSAFHRTGSTNAPPSGQRRSSVRKSSRVRSLPDRPRQCPVRFGGGIRLTIHSSVPPINPMSWLAAFAECRLYGGKGRSASLHELMWVPQTAVAGQCYHSRDQGIATRGQTSRAPR
jgi:hypothetical protein